MRPGRFNHFLAIDWSGAKGERQKGIALALCAAGDAAPRLVRPGHIWSRADVLQYLANDLPDDTLVGLDLGISLPFADRRAFFPKWPGSPSNARELWALVEEMCAGEEHLGANAFTDHPEFSPYFRRHGGREGAHFGGGRGRLRVTEEHQQRIGCNPYSNFNLVGAAQVGKSSLTGMRMLHRIGESLPVWPIDPVPESGSAIVEIYTSLAAIAAGRRKGRSKIRNRAELNEALNALGTRNWQGKTPLDDHRADALLTSAWLRNAALVPTLWSPQALTDQVAATEGWTFGVP